MKKKERLNQKKRELFNKKNVKEDNIDLDDMEITDDIISNADVWAKWRIRSRANAKKYGLSWDIVENTSTLCLMPVFMCLFQIIGVSDPLINVLLENQGMINQFLASNDWIIKFGVSYSVSTYLTRLASIPIFRYWCVPRSNEKFGEY